MRANPRPHQIICREAVKNSAQKQLKVLIDFPLQAKERMRGYNPGWHDRGNQREPVGGGRHVAVGQTRPRE